MFINFIKVTLRNIAAHKIYAAINILGLAIGITCALIITLYINHELSFDKFHTDYKSIYRITLHGQIRGIKFDGATTSAKMAGYLKKDTEGITDITRVTRLGAWLIAKDSIRNNEDNVLFVDSNFLNFFDGFKVIEGNKATMLTEPRSIVLTKSSAIKYFGSTHSVIGQKLKVETKEKPYVVTGIVDDAPGNSHIQFDLLASISTFDEILSGAWSSNYVYTYLKIPQKSHIESVLGSMNALFDKYIRIEIINAIDDIFQPDDEYKFNLQPLSQIHLHSGLEAELQPNGKAVYVYSLGIIAVLILIIACLNFMNLSTANSINRSFEVSLRKVVGAVKRHLILQFLVESVVISLIALIFALLLAELLLPYFNEFLGLSLQFSLFENFRAVLLILLFTTGVGILAGSSPAFYISKFDPVEILNGKFIQGLKSSKIRSVFVVMQFVISITIIILTIVIYAQVNFMKNKKLGFDNENILVIRRSDALGDKLVDFKSEIKQTSSVISVTNSNSIPGRAFYLNTFKLKGKEEDAALLFNQVFVNYDFLETFKLKIKQGRFFDPMSFNDTLSCVINESAAKEMGLSYPINAELFQPNVIKKTTRIYKVVGVVEDFHFKSLDEKIDPLVICLMPGNWEGYLDIKVEPYQIDKTIAFIEKVWYKYAPDYPFVFFFLNDDFNKNYEVPIKLGRVFIIFSILAIFVACLGLYGLIAYATKQRTREIGIRKTIGASVTNLLLLLTVETIRLLFISSVIACSIAYVVISYWLNDYYYKIEINAIYFIIAVVLVFVISMPTVIYHSIKAARKNPGEALR
jgi:putative ABC transport system permease protein